MDITQDYFTLFGVERSYFPDMQTVNSNYRKLQRQFHPDKFSGKLAQEKQLALQMASLINDGLRIMQDDVARAEYLLKLSGADLDDSSTINDVVFLQTQIELRDELKGLDSKIEITKFVNKIEQQLTNVSLEFASELAQDLTAATRLLHRLKFFNKLKQEARLKL